jgi:hypothetical protein
VTPPIMTLARDRGKRIANHWIAFDSGSHGLDFCVERQYGTTWKRAYGLKIMLCELWLVSDDLKRDMSLAEGVRR